MNTRFLETFVTLAQLQSFRATARTLHATPATISLRIRTLEDELKCKLVDRRSHKFRLTPAGQYLVDFARDVIDAARRLREAAGAEPVVGGTLRLGVNETVVHSWLAHYLSYLNARFPTLEVDLAVDTSAALQKRLLAGELDMALRIEGVDSPRVVSRSIASYPVRWIARRDLLAQHSDGLTQQILKRPVLTFGRGTTPQIALEQIVRGIAMEHGMRIDQMRIICSPSVAAIVQLVRDGYGVAAIPRLFVADALSSGEFAEIPLRPAPPPIVISSCARADAGVTVSAAVDAAHEACAEYCLGQPGEFIEAL